MPAIPASVQSVLGQSGHSLDARSRAYFESRLGHDFSQVRVHTSPSAAASAAAIDAHAYTVGEHVVFGAGQYAPNSRAGRKLIAHELAHVVQQARGGAPGRLQAASIASPPDPRFAPEDEELEREAETVSENATSGGIATPVAVRGVAGVLRLQRAPRRTPAIVGLDPAGPEADLTGKTENSLLACMKGAKADPSVCDPSRTLTWADFAGPAKGGKFSAETHSGITDQPMDPIRAGCLQRILGKSADETRVFQAKLDTKKSWGRKQFKDPTNTANTGCKKGVDACTKFFAAEARAGRTGGTFTFGGKPSATCAASAVAAQVTATSSGDCAALETECTKASVAESQRLLRHEQGHFDITCVIAGKANSALQAGSKLADIKTAHKKQLAATQKAYDNETDHGCNAGQQARWETDITNKLPKVTVP